MPKHVSFQKLVSAIVSMSRMLETTLLKQLCAAVKSCMSETVVDETAKDRLWKLYQEIPPSLRSQFRV